MDNTQDLDIRFKKERKKYLKWIAILVVVNTIIFTLVMGKSTRGIMGSFQAALFSNLIGFNIIGFLLGLPFALIPHRGLSYQKRYLRASILAVLLIQLLMFLCLICVGFMILTMGTKPLFQGTI